MTAVPHRSVEGDSVDVPADMSGNHADGASVAVSATALAASTSAAPSKVASPGADAPASSRMRAFIPRSRRTYDVQPTFTHWAQYLGARLATMGLTFFDVDANLHTAGWIGRMMHRFDRRHRERARESIARCFPERSEAEIDELVVKSFEHFVQLVVEIIHTSRMMHSQSWYRHVRYQNIAPVLELLNDNRPVLLITGHLGNWEVLGYVMALLGYPVHAIARPLDNPLLNEWLLGIREQTGMTIITKWNATDRMVEVLNAGQPLGFIADQNAGDKGLFVPFFGRLASTYKSIGLLAMNQNAPIACGGALRVGNGYNYELITQDIIYPEDWANQPDPLYYITARYIRAIEMMIRRDPSQYLWMHRRWKSRPRFEREGKPMPAALQRNLEQLPWMTQEELDRLKQPYCE